MKKYSYLLFATIALSGAVMTGCKKSDSFTIPPEVASFTNLTFERYEVTGPTVTYKVPIGLSTIAAQDRTVTVDISSPTGAVEGQHYTVDSKTVTIPAGKAVDSLTVQGNYADYISGRKDTLIFTIVEGGVSPSDYNNKFTLYMRGPCFASEINTELLALMGDYHNTTETYAIAYGPYTTSISSVVQTSPTTADITVLNLYDDDPDWNPIKFTIDWSDLNNMTVVLAGQQVAGGDAGGTFGSAYNGQAHVVRAPAGQVGKLEFCAQKLTLKMEVGVQNVGYAAGIYTVNMAR